MLGRYALYRPAMQNSCQSRLEFIRLVEEVAVSHAVDGSVDDLAAAGASEFVRDVEVGEGERVRFAVGAFVGDEEQSQPRRGLPPCSPLRARRGEDSNNG